MRMEISSDHNHSMRKSSISEQTFRRIAKGDTVVYVLSPSAQPTHPEREWHGRVLYTGGEAVVVTVLDEGYTGEMETVKLTQIVAVKKAL
jgi:ribosomal protein L21E